MTRFQTIQSMIKLSGELDPVQFKERTDGAISQDIEISH